MSRSTDSWRARSTSSGSPGSSRRPWSASGRAAADPDIDALIALDAEVRATFATGSVGGVALIGILHPVITIVLFFLILGTLVVIHEFGHFVAARLAGVRVLEFGIGFPPRAKVLRSKGETLYTLNWLPIGGFVKLEGEDGDDADDPRSFVIEEPARQARDPRLGRRHERPARVRDLHGRSPGSRRL